MQNVINAKFTHVRFSAEKLLFSLAYTWWQNFTGQIEINSVPGENRDSAAAQNSAIFTKFTKYRNLAKMPQFCQKCRDFFSKNHHKLCILQVNHVLFGTHVYWTFENSVCL